jgi:hypothetical protein
MTAVGKAALSQTPPAFACKLPGGELCVTQEPHHQLLCLTLSGELRNVVDPSGELLQFPTGIACDGESLFVADGLGDRVHRLRLPNFRLCASTSDDLSLHYAHGVCLHPTVEMEGSGGGSVARTLFVADWGNHRIVALDPDTLAVSFVFGRKGRGPGELMYPRGVASLSEDRLLIADTDNDRLQIVEASSGAFLCQIGGVEQPYAAVGAPGAGGDGLSFVATMAGRLSILPISRRDESQNESGGAGGAGGAGTGAGGALSSMRLMKEVAMPSGGRILCGLCTDGRRVLVAGLDEERQLHLLAARPGDGGRASTPALRASTPCVAASAAHALSSVSASAAESPSGRGSANMSPSSGDRSWRFGGGAPPATAADVLSLAPAYDMLSLEPVARPGSNARAGRRAHKEHAPAPMPVGLS